MQEPLQLFNRASATGFEKQLDQLEAIANDADRTSF